MALVSWQNVLYERERHLGERQYALDCRERALAAREALADGRDISDGLEIVARAWTVGSERVIARLLDLMVHTGDDPATVARGLGLDPAWVQALLHGEIVDIDVVHVRRVCEGLACTPYDLLGPEAARTIEHAYGPELWPPDAEPLEGGSEATRRFDPA